MKYCAKCKETKPIEKFYNNRSQYDGKCGYCIPCWKDKMLERQNTPEKMRGIHLQRRYKLTIEQYYEKLQAQGNGCAICGSKTHGFSTRINDLSFSVDHSHKCCDKEYTCGKCVRGLLCSSCNNRLGVLEKILSNEEWTMKAKEYLESWY